MVSSRGWCRCVLLAVAGAVALAGCGAAADPSGRTAASPGSPDIAQQTTESFAAACGVTQVYEPNDDWTDSPGQAVDDPRAAAHDLALRELDRLESIESFDERLAAAQALLERVEGGEPLTREERDSGLASGLDLAVAHRAFTALDRAFDDDTIVITEGEDEAYVEFSTPAGHPPASVTAEPTHHGWHALIFSYGVPAFLCHD